MAKTTSRVLALLNLLQTHRQWSGPQLAERLSVTERTLRRDVERLRALGYRIEAARGATGGYRLEAGSQLPPLLLTDDEAVTMAIGLRVAASQGIVEGEQTTLSAMAKFEQILPSALRERVNAIAGLARSETPRSAAAVSPDMLGQLALACRDGERIRFHYVAANGDETDRVVEPHSLVAAEHSWFLVCWDLRRDDWRTFRIDRMSRFFGTRLRFESRDLPAENAAEFVAAAVASLRRRHNAEVLIALPLEEMVEYFGPWSKGVTRVDDETTSWPIGGDSFELMLMVLLWIPAGVEYELRGSDEFLAFAHEATGRLNRSLRAT
ncbi:WYL domain-containing protein [Glaciihabitans sp. UYNi722]|uniref:helix-turn-helix transcriptional regulator n=1 Tax=Glaciihabitans sp. UYNi722 TaxID=3156344 RepID=UPI003399EF10